jgi:hypothetical protein
MPQLHALQFDLATPPPRFTSVIVWIEGNLRSPQSEATSALSEYNQLEMAIHPLR